MKSLIATVVFVVSSIAMYAQKDVTKFLGIPVDGTKSEMIRKLEAKGFKLDKNSKEYLGEDILEGEFNGQDVYLSVVTHNNKVYRIAIMDVNYTNHIIVKSRFNRLCRQFLDNENYCSYNGSQTIWDNEDVAYAMDAYDKRYEASFYQKLNMSDEYKNEIYNRVKANYSPEQLESQKEEIETACSAALFDDSIMRADKKCVWFIIDKKDGKYGIIMFYDNKYNQADGEDL